MKISIMVDPRNWLHFREVAYIGQQDRFWLHVAILAKDEIIMIHHAAP